MKKQTWISLVLIGLALLITGCSASPKFASATPQNSMKAADPQVSLPATPNEESPPAAANPPSSTPQPVEPSCLVANPVPRPAAGMTRRVCGSNEEAVLNRVVSLGSAIGTHFITAYTVSAGTNHALQVAYVNVLPGCGDVHLFLNNYEPFKWIISDPTNRVKSVKLAAYYTSSVYLSGRLVDTSQQSSLNRAFYRSVIAGGGYDGDSEPLYVENFETDRVHDFSISKFEQEMSKSTVLPITDFQAAYEACTPFVIE